MDIVQKSIFNCGSDRVPPACSSSGPTTQCFEGQCGCTDRLIGIGESQFKCILSIKPVFWFSLSAVQPWFIYSTVNIGQNEKCRMIANIINIFQRSLSKRNLNLKGKVKSICICMEITYLPHFWNHAHYSRCLILGAGQVGIGFLNLLMQTNYFNYLTHLGARKLQSRCP